MNIVKTSSTLAAVAACAGCTSVLDLWLSVDALATIEAVSADKYPLEAGGILVGYRSGASQIVESAIGPGPNAVHDRYSFHSDHKWQCDQLDELFLQSKGRQVYSEGGTRIPKGPVG